MVGKVSSVNSQKVNNQTSFSAKAQQQMIDRKVFDTFKLQAGSKTAYMPTGHLVKTNDPISGLAVGIKDTAVDAKNLVNTIKTGKSNDHALGRMNDLGLKLGGALIAGYLASKKMAPTAKAMEFVGLGAFLASMSLWPRLTIDAPIRAKNGFNIRQKYIDNEGRKKEFFQDNQYLPWDLWTNEQINEIADKMGIDKNMKDREEFTKKKMQKIALQGNTAWMLSCGLGVPLTTSMICKAAEKPLELFNTGHAITKSQRKLKHLTDGTQGIADYIHRIKDADVDFTKLEGSIDTKVERIFEEIDPLRLLKKAKDQDSRNLVKEMHGYSQGLKDEIRTMLTPKYVDNVDDFACALSEKFFKGAKIQVEDEFGNLVDKAVSLDALKAAVKKANVHDGRNFVEKLLSAIVSDDSLFIPAKSQEEFASSVAGLIQEKGFAKGSEAEALQILSKNGRIARGLQRRMSTLSEAVNSIFGERAESAATLKYHDIADSILTQTGKKRDMKALKAMKGDSHRTKAFETVFEFFGKKAAVTAEGDDAYIKAFSELAGGKKKGLFSRKISSIFGHLAQGSTSSINIDEAIEHAGDGLDEVPILKKLFKSDSLSGFGQSIGKFIRESRLNTSSISHRALATLDFERRVSERKALEEFVRGRFGNTDSIDEFIDIARKVIYNGTDKDFSSASKFVKAGKEEVWDAVLEFLFNNPVADATRHAIDKANAGELKDLSEEGIANLKSFDAYRARLFKALKPAGNRKVSPSKENFLLMGKSVTEMVQETSQKLYNNKHWLKIFGIATIAVAAVTAAATFAFGKMKEQKLYEQQSGGTGNVSQ